MTPYVDVSFHGLPRDVSIEAAIHRWVARLEAMRIEIQRAQITVEVSGRRRTSVTLILRLMDGNSRTTASVHADAYVGVADAFRAAKQLLQPVAPPRARVWAA
jgi:hypothetical protein